MSEYVQKLLNKIEKEGNNKAQLLSLLELLNDNLSKLREQYNYLRDFNFYSVITTEDLIKDHCNEIKNIINKKIFDTIVDIEVVKSEIKEYGF
jgi:long-subunit acyl-CoA synthetase (AMP-forming)